MIAATEREAEQAAMSREEEDAHRLAKVLREENGYLAVRVLPDNSVAVLADLMTTRAIMLGCNYAGFEQRFCFRDRMLAVIRFGELQSADDVPQGFIARRPELRDSIGNYLGAAECQCGHAMEKCPGIKCFAKPGRSACAN